MGNIAEDFSDSDSLIRSLAASADHIDGRMEVLVLGIIASILNDANLLSLAESKAHGFADLVKNAGRYLPSSESCVLACLAYVAFSRKDVKSAQEIYPALCSQPGQWCSLCSADHLRGMLAQTLGNVDCAALHFEDAVGFCTKVGYRLELAWTCYDYAESLLHRNGRGDVVKARSLLDEATSISSEMGMRPLMERSLDLLEQLQAQPKSKSMPTYPDGLTRREVEVLRLIATGKTDREIAEELFISARTVTTHVSNILNKTNTANRVEATAYALRQGLA